MLKKHKRNTIAFFGSSPGGARIYDKWQMWRGIAEVARENDLNVIYVAGEDIDDGPQAVLYSLVDLNQIDGLIVWNTFSTPHRNNLSVRDFYDLFPNLPIVSIEQDVENSSCLTVDYAGGIHELITHLVQIHGFTRIAFTPDPTNPYSSEQQSEFIKWLTLNELFDKKLIGQLDDFDALGLVPGDDYQAIITGSDNTAAYVITNLQARGINIPDQVAVTGFNDGQQARGQVPPLTTIRIPFRKMGRQAVKMLIRLIEERDNHEYYRVPIKLITRRSCGCLDQTAEKAVVGSLPKSSEILEDYILRNQEGMIQEIASGLGSSAEGFSIQWAQSIFDGFIAELFEQRKGVIQSPSRRFLNILSKVLQETVVEDINPNRWHESISTFRRHLWPHLLGASLAFTEDMFQQARILIGQTAARSEVHRHWKAAQHVEILNEISSALLTTFEIDLLSNILANSLPKLGINSCFLAFYQNPLTPYSHVNIVMEIKEGHRLNHTPGMTFFTKDVISAQFQKNGPRRSLLMIDLFFLDEQIGFLVFEAEPPEIALESNVFTELQKQLSSALKGIRLRQELQEAKKKAEEANLLQSRFLSVVSHELRTPLNLIVGLSEMALREQARGVTASFDVLKKYQEQIHTSGQHLDRLIRDVLDLANSQTGQMELIFSTVDLASVLQDAAVMGRQLADQKQLVFVIGLPDKLPKVWGDKTRLRQVLLNLLSNAVKFTAYGEVGLSAIVDEKFVNISIWDTGLGIEQDDQEKIFNEFYQSDRKAQRGYGGMGLGLAITRRLVEKHGGTIQVSSSGKEELGSRFTFCLPYLIDKPEQTISTQTNLHKVYILSKMEGTGEKLSQRLTEIGFRSEVIFIGDEYNLPNIIQQNPADAVILDFEPASEKGWEVMKMLKENRATQDVPVLFYSLLEESNSGSILEIEILKKPIETSDLLLALQRHGIKVTSTTNGSKILIIDDEPGILDLHTSLLCDELPKAQIFTARSGAEGLEIMRKNHPNLVLLDLMMPEMDGFEVLQRMQEEENLRNIPVIILSAQSLGRHEIARLGRGVAAILGKGLFTVEETLSRIEEALSRRKKMGIETQRLVRQAMAYIHEHFSESITRTDIAQKMCINEQYLTRCFKKELGTSPIAYLNRYRIHQAKKLLESGHLSITQIALRCGYSSQSYFSRAFQRETGISPSEHQNRYKSLSL